jgi:hypothetical protein
MTRSTGCFVFRACLHYALSLISSFVLSPIPFRFQRGAVRVWTSPSVGNRRFARALLPEWLRCRTSIERPVRKRQAVPSGESRTDENNQDTFFRSFLWCGILASAASADDVVPSLVDASEVPWCLRRLPEMKRLSSSLDSRDTFAHRRSSA